MKTIELKKRFPHSRPEDIGKAYSLGFEQGLKSDARAKMYRRQLGGAEAALRRERQKREELEELVREMWSVMWACAEQRCTHRKAGCFRVAGNVTRPQGDGACWFEARLRELGVEP